MKTPAHLRHLVLSVGIAAAASTSALAQSTGSSSATPSAGAALASPEAFATKAAQGNMAEIASAKLAQQKSKNPDVLAFAKRMIDDHTKAEAQLVKIMQAQGMTPPATVDAKHQAEMAKLQGMDGSAFDNAYISGEVPDHQEMLSMLQAEENAGNNPQLAAWSKDTAPVVAQHLDMAKADVQKLSGH